MIGKLTRLASEKVREGGHPVPQDVELLVYYPFAPQVGYSFYFVIEAEKKPITTNKVVEVDTEGFATKSSAYKLETIDPS